MRYIYGPVKSRRLGFSLGVSTVPAKICSFDCVYCQLGRTSEKTRQRAAYVDAKEVLTEIRTFFKNKPKGLAVDHITFSGSGEPMLILGLGRLIRGIRKITPTPIVLITNSSVLVEARARREGVGVDLIIPSLDAVTQDIFEKIDRPVPGILVDEIIEAIIKFKKRFSGEMWLEIMLVRGCNDSVAYLRKIKKVVDAINPDRVQINTPVRVPAQDWVRPPTAATLKKAREIFGKKCDII
jgi:wyosine [tRNA(Phe)-imidazoG37] synthetase (radical SAM superfamily)